MHLCVIHMHTTMVSCEQDEISLELLLLATIIITATLTEHARREGFKSASSIALDISTMTNKCLI